VNWERAVAVYRESPNTYGHEDAQKDRALLKRLLGAIGSQKFLQDSIKDSQAEGYYDVSMGVRHLWERLKDCEDFLRECEERSGDKIAPLAYMTFPGDFHCVPTVAKLQQVLRNKKE
jgi:hypothetical protein